jgi:orotate phosphoribosyltransferase
MPSPPMAATRGRALKSFTVRKEAKDHGITGRIAGALEPGDRVVITEDTVTRGTSPMEAVRAVREFGADADPRSRSSSIGAARVARWPRPRASRSCRC